MSIGEHSCPECERDPIQRNRPYHASIGHYPFWHEPCLECGVERSSYGERQKCPDFDGSEFGDCRCGHSRAQHAKMVHGAPGSF